ncbi:hypothetical protein SAMN05216516_10847 [Izhakiella capsodis]|uniref:Nicotinamidase/pyrazinamidase n=1 Tax=Izhakiella capsodis TaxID=1367852 RepID=A0A1I4Z8W8_9GAMM|nr:hypothetical protein SAMN05216516_10847 [Izhakiella capsodis]
MLIDIQNDFCPGGALAVHNGDRVVPVANNCMAPWNAHGVLVTWPGHRQINALMVMELATDYCVKFSVLDTLEAGNAMNQAAGCRGVNLHLRIASRRWLK